MADNWAAFKTSESGKNEDGDDDWADFGGFESASPASNPFGDSTASAGFPWATAFPTASQHQLAPPASKTQGTFPVQTSAFPTSTEQTNNARLQTQSTNLFLSDPGGEYATLTNAHSGLPGQVSLPTQQLEQLTNTSPLKGDAPFQPTSVLGGTPTPQPQPNTGVHTKPNAVSTNDLFISPSKEITTQSAPPIPSRERRNTNELAVDEAKLSKVQGELKEANDKLNDYRNQMQGSEEKLSLAEREKIRLEKSLEEMKKKYTEAADVAKEQYLEIERQKEQYDQLEERHKEQLKNLREAGQEAFALIVEEYKELSKTAVAQERENNEKHLQRALNEEREKFTTFVNQQGENLKLLVTEEQANNLKKLEEALEEQKIKHQDELNECLEEERRRGKEAIERAVEDERARAKELTEELLEGQKKEFEAFMTEQKKIFEENLSEERKRTTKQVKEALKEEQERAREKLDEAMAEERNKSRDAFGVIKEKTKEEMGLYIKEKEKADDAVRLRSYQSMDLFLQGVQTQLRSLINNSDTPPSS